MKTLKIKDVEKVIESISTYQLEKVTITMITTKNKKDDGRFYKRNEVTSVETITTEQYIMFLESTSWFINFGGKESIEKGYTVAGYLPTELLSVSPAGDCKTLRKFCFELK